MTASWRVGAALLSTVAVAAIVALSQVPASLADIEGSLVRLSWRAPGVAVERCHTLTPEELDALPAHMRRREVCTGRNADYVLRVEVDSELAVLDTIRPAGARGDRPLYVFRDVPVRSGARDVLVTFDALVPADFVAGDRRTSYRWEGSLNLLPAEIGLLTLGDDGSTLVRVRPGV